MLSRSMGKVVIVGAGLTGAVAASALRQTVGQKIDIEVWDKSRGTGEHFDSIIWQSDWYAWMIKRDV